MCLVHLLGELKKVVMYKDSSGDWAAFSKKLKRLVQDAVRLWRRREEFDEVVYACRRKRIELRLRELIETQEKLLAQSCYNGCSIKNRVYEDGPP